jgi:hypothetical protein
MQLKTIKVLSGIVGIYFLAWAMKLSYGDAIFILVVGGGIYFISGVWYKGKRKK